MCTTPFSGPSQRIWLSPMSRRASAPGSATSSSTGSPVTIVASDRMAATSISVPRPTVKTNP
jgi:hypothetical protein